MKSRLNRGKAESRRMREEERIHLFVKEQPKVKVVCYHCGRIVDKEDAFYISRFDAYLCPRCYLRLLEGKSVRLPNWRKRGV